MIKHMNITEFRELGFLQEANRLFFHPHGLALEVATNNDEPTVLLKLTKEEYKALEALLFAITGEEDDDDAALSLNAIQMNKEIVPAGEYWLSGVWDCRDDPEGVIFDGLSDEEKTRAMAVRSERARHFNARVELFSGKMNRLSQSSLEYAMKNGVDSPDVEPVISYENLNDPFRMAAINKRGVVLTEDDDPTGDAS